jgi:hypothetical protein
MNTRVNPRSRRIPGEPRVGLAIVLVERGVRIAVIALAQHEFGVRDLQVLA